MSEIQGRKEVHALWTSLQSEYERYKNAVRYIPTKELRLQDDLRRYLCLRCAGFLEQMTYFAVMDFLGRKSSGPGLEFATSFFKTVPNLRAGPFVDLVGRFGPSYQERFELFLAKTRRDALNDLLAVRNDIAHGKYHAGRKLDPERYMQLCKEIYDWFLLEFLDQEVVITSGSEISR